MVATVGVGVDAGVRVAVHLCQVQHDEARPPRASPLIITPTFARAGLLRLLRRHRRALATLLTPPCAGRVVVAQRELQVAHLVRG